ncbi:MAG: hypothetical protein ABI807_06450 [Sporichthyaceae bacterium]
MTERDEPLGPDDIKVPEADTVEQRADAVDRDEDTDPADHGTAEADPADVAELSRAVGVEDDEYR